MFSFNPDWIALIGLLVNDVVSPNVATCGHSDIRTRALEHQHAGTGFTTSHGKRFVSNRLQWQRLTATELAVAGNQHFGAGIADAIAQRLRRETTEYDGVGCANTGTGLHRGDTVNGHRHVNNDAITLLNTEFFQCIGNLRNARQQLFVSHFGDLAIIGFKNQRNFVAQTTLNLTIKTVVRRIQLAIHKPAIGRRIGFVQNFSERRLPAEEFLGTLAPVTLVILLCFGTKGLVSIHARYSCILYEVRGRLVDLCGFIRHVASPRYC